MGAILGQKISYFTHKKNTQYGGLGNPSAVTLKVCKVITARCQVVRQLCHIPQN